MSPSADSGGPSPRSLAAVVLAAGEGTRMHSTRPKPAHLLCGRPMILHVLDALAELPIERVVVVIGRGADPLIRQVAQGLPASLEVDFVEQHTPRGTGDAVSVALTAFPDDDDDGDIVVLPGDTPLVRPPTLAALVREHRSSDAAGSVLTTSLPHAAGYDRIVRGKGERILHIVSDAEATLLEREVTEISTSIYCFRRSLLAPSLRRLSPENSHGEYYLSDVIEVLSEAGYTIASLLAPDPMETAGVNDRAQLAIAEAELRDRTNERWMRRGVTMLDPERTYLDTSVELAADVTLFPGTILRGATTIGAGAHIGPDTHLVNCVVGERAVVENTVARDADIGADARVGPFAVLGPGTKVAPETVTEPFFVAG